VSDILNSGPEQVVTGDEAAGGAFGFDDETGAPRGEREGLPRNYRMRADKHYVEQLVTRSAGQPVRMVAIAEIDSDDPFREMDLRPLLESIRTHGIVHPLLIRRHNGRYAIVAGRRRLAAAHLLRLTTVPCLVQDLDEAQAAALAAADNLTLNAVAARPGEVGLALGVRQVVAHHLETIRACTDLVSGGMPTMTRSVFDLVRAHTWRAARLIDAIDLIGSVAPPPGRDRRLSTVLDEVVDGFGPESRLNAFSIRAHIADEATSSGLNHHELQAGLAAALLATLPLIEPVPQASVQVTATTSGAGSVVVDVAQAAATVPAELARRFFDEDTAGLRAGGWSAVAGALAVRALADRYRGSATFDAGPHGGSTLRIELVRRS
jgi:hypothetical protein